MKSLVGFFLLCLLSARHCLGNSEDAEHDLGWLVYLDGISIVDVPEGLMNRSCSLVERKFDRVECDSAWLSGFHVIEKRGKLSLKRQQKIAEYLDRQKGIPEGGRFKFERNLPVVSAGRLLAGSTKITYHRKAPLNLARLDNKNNLRDRTYRYRTSGKGVNVYVLDDGINLNHEEFLTKDKKRSRAHYGLNLFPETAAPCAMHGTHVSGIVGGLKYGVAKDVEIYMVNVQPCGAPGSTKYLIKGLEWIRQHAVRPAVVHMSLLSAGEALLLNEAVKDIIDNGISFVVSAGNYGTDASGFSPAMVDGAIVVGNIDDRDVLHPSSNFGEKVDIFAPGVKILGPSADGNKSLQYFTGTSQSAPHVTGVVAQILERMPKASPAEVKARLVEISAKDKILDTKVVDCQLW